MGMDLYRATDNVYFRWGLPYWFAVLELAQRNGWQPMGTTNPRRSEWDGNYTENACQTVRYADAVAMAMALERGLPDIPREDAVAHKKEKGIDLQKAISSPVVMLETNEVPNLAEVLDAEILVGGLFKEDVWRTMNCFEKLAGAQAKLKDFIAYLRVGGFVIH